MRVLSVYQYSSYSQVVGAANDADVVSAVYGRPERGKPDGPPRHGLGRQIPVEAFLLLPKVEEAVEYDAPIYREYNQPVYRCHRATRNENLPRRARRTRRDRLDSTASVPGSLGAVALAEAAAWEC